MVLIGLYRLQKKTVENLPFRFVFNSDPEYMTIGMN